MFDIFEQPWTLVGLAVLVLFGMFTFRSVFPEKRRWWQLLVPVLLAAAAFGLDLLVPTDLEKINAVINRGVKAVEQEDCDAIGAILAEDYRDSRHQTKQALMAHCRRELSKPLLKKNKKTGVLIRISGPQATATLFTTMIFEKDSYVAQSYKNWLMIKMELYLSKRPDEGWLINRVNVLEIDRQPVSWGDIR
jgi:hypothetical protein